MASSRTLGSALAAAATLAILCVHPRADRRTRSKVRDREDALASRYSRVAPQTSRRLPLHSDFARNDR